MPGSGRLTIWGVKRLLDKRDSTGTGYSLLLDGGILKFQLGSVIYNSTEFVADGMANAGNWHHVAVTAKRDVSPPVGKFYVDGVHIVAGDFSPLPGPLTNSGPLVMGCSSLSHNECYRGALDEIEFFDRGPDGRTRSRPSSMPGQAASANPRPRSRRQPRLPRRAHPRQRRRAPPRRPQRARPRQPRRARLHPRRPHAPWCRRPPR